MTFIETFSAVFLAVTLSEIAKKIFTRYLEKHVDNAIEKAEKTGMKTLKQAGIIEIERKKRIRKIIEEEVEEPVVQRKLKKELGIEENGSQKS